MDAEREGHVKISPQSAMQIVTEIGAIVGQNINLMDGTGVIIASTDPARIGDEHAAAKRIIEEGLEELYVTREENTPTTRTGLNLGLRFQGEVVAVIGITGSYDDVKDYGQIVRKMTEILIRENVEQELQKFDMRVYSRFLEEWVLNPPNANLHTLKERGTNLGIDIDEPRRIVIVSLKSIEEYVSTTEGQRLIDEVEAAITALLREKSGDATKLRTMILRKEATQILLLPQQSDASLVQLAQSIVSMVQERFGLPLAIGYDGAERAIHAAYLQANRAWRSAKLGHVAICGYREITMELFLPDIPRVAKDAYLNKVFPKTSAEELAVWMEILKAYFQSDGSIAKASEALYMHRNTYQYQLKKIREITGFDVRKPSEAPILYMAQLFYLERRMMELDGSL